MPESYTISSSNLSVDQISELYTDIRQSYQISDASDLNIIFNIALGDTSLFPNIKLSNPTPTEYLKEWITKYIRAINDPPSRRIANPKNSCSDPAVMTLVQNCKQYTEEQTNFAQLAHNLCMSAENIQGSLLEEFIAKNIRKFGFIYCAGNTLRSIDFCNTSGTCLLQIKNKNNTENSSSSQVRDGTSIIKWFRLKTSRRSGVITPLFEWDTLNDIVNSHSDNPNEQCNLSEQSYSHFIESVSNRNRALINEN